MEVHEIKFYGFLGRNGTPWFFLIFIDFLRLKWKPLIFKCQGYLASNGNPWYLHVKFGGGWVIKDKYNKCNVIGHRLICTYLIQGHAARVPSLTPDPTRRFALSCLSPFCLLLVVVLLFTFASLRRTRPLPPLSHVSRSAPHRSPPVPQGIQRQALFSCLLL